MMVCTAAHLRSRAFAHCLRFAEPWPYASRRRRLSRRRRYARLGVDLVLRQGASGPEDLRRTHQRLQRQ